MTRPLPARWVLYTLVLLLAAAAVFAPEAGTPVELVQPVLRSQAAPPARASAAGTALALPQSRGLPAPSGDPFATPHAAAPETAAIGRLATPQARVHTAPPVPFVFLGRWQERDRHFVFLQRGDRSYKVEQAGPLDGDYTVVALGERSLQLRYEPLGLVQELRFDNPPATPPVRALAAQTAASAPTPGTDPAEN